MSAPPKRREPLNLGPAGVAVNHLITAQGWYMAGGQGQLGQLRVFAPAARRLYTDMFHRGDEPWPTIAAKTREV